MKRMGAREFREMGLLQEVNRRLLHPLGLALEVVVEADGTVRFGEVLDARDDPEGFHFEEGLDLSIYAEAVQAEINRRAHNRNRALGYIVQPAARVD